MKKLKSELITEVKDNASLSNSSDIFRDREKRRNVRDIFSIDFIGTDTSQPLLHLLAAKPIDHSQSVEAKLSARGLHHRPRSQFEKDIKTANNIIQTSLNARNENLAIVDRTGTHTRPDFHLYPQFFQRAVAYERTGKFRMAIQSYDMVLNIFPECAAAHFNKAGLNAYLEKYDEALVGINKAISIEPANLNFRKNLSLLLRRKGHFIEAINETITIRSVDLQPGLAKELENGGKVSIDSGLLLQGLRSLVHQRNHVEEAMEMNSQIKSGMHGKLTGKLSSQSTFSVGVDYLENMLTADGPKKEVILDFLAGIKVFEYLASNRNVLAKVVDIMRLKTFEPEEYVFRIETQENHTYVVIRGEVCVTKGKSNWDLSNKYLRSKYLETRSLAVYTTGDVFSEMLGSIRSAGGICTEPAALLVMSTREYQSIVLEYQMSVRESLKSAISSCPVFAHWSEEDVDQLAGVARLVTINAHNEIYKAGQKISKLFIVESGVVRLIRQIEKNALLTNNVASTLSANYLPSERGSVSFGTTPTPNVSTADKLPFIKSRRTSFVNSQANKSELVHEHSDAIGPNNNDSSNFCKASSDQKYNDNGRNSVYQSKGRQLTSRLTNRTTVSNSMAATTPSPGMWVIEKSWRDIASDQTHESILNKLGVNNEFTSKSDTPNLGTSNSLVRQPSVSKRTLGSASHTDIASGERDSELIVTVGVLGSGQVGYCTHSTHCDIAMYNDTVNFEVSLPLSTF